MIYRLSWCWMGLLSTVIFTVWLDLGADIFAWREARANAGANVALTLSTDGCASPGDTRPRWWSCHRVACCSAVPSCLRSHPFIWSVWSETEDFKACHQCSSNLLGYDRYLGFITQRRSFVSILSTALWAAVLLMCIRKSDSSYLSFIPIFLSKVLLSEDPRENIWQRAKVCDYYFNFRK